MSHTYAGNLIKKYGGLIWSDGIARFINVFYLHKLKKRGSQLLSRCPILLLQCMRIMIDTVRKSMAKCPDFGYFCKMGPCIRKVRKTLLIKYCADDTYKRSAEVANTPLYKSDDTKSVFSKLRTLCFLISNRTHYFLSFSG